MGKNDREKQMLYEWGKTKGTDYQFPGIETSKESYYIQRDTGADKMPYMREYGFETLPELMKELETLWNQEEVMESVKKVVGIAAIKNKPTEVMQKAVEINKKEDTEEKLPAFIYNF